MKFEELVLQCGEIIENRIRYRNQIVRLLTVGAGFGQDLKSQSGNLDAWLLDWITYFIKFKQKIAIIVFLTSKYY